MPTAANPSRERVARLLLLALILALPLAFLPTLFEAGTPEPLPQRPTHLHLIVITTGVWQAADSGTAPHPALAEFELRATGHVQTYTPSNSSAGSAASLWTGRWPASHGVRSNDRALAPGAWTLATAARQTGARTAAFLEEPFASATGIGGFDVLVEDPDQGPAALAAAARAHLEGQAGARNLLWLHLRESGAGGSQVGALLGELRPFLAAEGLLPDSLILLTAFRSSGVAPGDAELRVPLLAQLPTSLYAGRRGSGSGCLVDLAGDVLCDLMHLPRPDTERGQAPLQSRPDSMEFGLKGSKQYYWVLLERPGEDILRQGANRVVSRIRPVRSSGDVQCQLLRDPTSDDSSSFRAAPAHRVEAMYAVFQSVLRVASSGAQPSTPASIPLSFSELPNG